MFGTVLTTIVTLMHVYVFWRASSVPFLKRQVTLKFIIGSCIALWMIFYLGRVFGHGGTGALAKTLELFGMNWMAVLFLTSVTLLTVDFVTCFGFLLPRLSPSLRGLALVAGGVLSVIALFQGLRPPVVQNYEVYLSDLPDVPEQPLPANRAPRAVKPEPLNMVLRVILRNMLRYCDFIRHSPY